MTRGQVGLGGNEASPRVTRLGSQLAMSTVLATDSAVKKRKKNDVVVILYRQEFHNFGGFFHSIVDYHVFFSWEATEIRFFFGTPGLKNGWFGWIRAWPGCPEAAVLRHHLDHLWEVWELRGPPFDGRGWKMCIFLGTALRYFFLPPKFGWHFLKMMMIIFEWLFRLVGYGFVPWRVY